MEKALVELGQVCPEDTADKLTTLVKELARWNRRVNLTAIRDPDKMIVGHLLDSLAARPLLRGSRILDVGTGAGFPGLPLAIVEPERSFVLLDSNNKKVMFVEHIAGLLGLRNVTAVKARTEDFAPGNRFDTVIARAVATLPRLVEIAGHHVGEGGVFVALKGRYPAEELEQLPATWDSSVTELKVPGLEAGSRHAVLIEHK
ncbi:MAG: 16S rRNA (guanine(527)-N(7))-methyltransferase RsmG [Gammaproteobacteria bacterium]|nr:16S rRNA (guanine(527)-N(7))-methyltransferase RsmG [Gammaproteobacteria bacterium]MDH3752134.1 16S rRNA (guanine(527)-N(7))-methyltransferase RsmG [Gammaproteobacteria bacterium]MDH3805591.1 16S rRNA (guanine(527)-N(7))-methyltransferase RsmG [Gammaproteobacteria bacterium]